MPIKRKNKTRLFMKIMLDLKWEKYCGSRISKKKIE
jgi:hypothetical protein